MKIQISKTLTSPFKEYIGCSIKNNKNHKFKTSTIFNSYYSIQGELFIEYLNRDNTIIKSQIRSIHQKNNILDRIIKLKLIS